VLQHHTSENVKCDGCRSNVKTDVAEEKLGEIPSRDTPFPDEPSGKEWDEENVNNLYPRLSGKYSFSDTGDGRDEHKKPWWNFW
jgi:hypothetical protein